eukprot:1456839-Prymnesium_polylepis.1
MRSAPTCDVAGPNKLTIFSGIFRRYSFVSPPAPRLGLPPGSSPARAVDPQAGRNGGQQGRAGVPAALQRRGGRPSR